MYQGWTSLMWASSRGHLEVVRLLVENKADVNAKEKDGKLVYIFWIC